MNSDMRFIAAGMTRRAYEKNGRCVKVPVEGREAAATGQNKAEYEKFRLAEKTGLRCFPKAYSLSEDGMELVEELVDPAFQSALESASEILLRKSGFDLLKYKEDVKLISVVVFSMAYVLHTAFDAGVRTYEEFVGWCFSEAGSSDNVSFFVDFQMSDAVNMMRNVVGDKRPRAKLPKALDGLIRFYFLKGGDFAVEDLWNSRQWGIASDGRLVAVDGGFSKSVQMSGHYGRDRVIPLKDVKRVTLPGDGDREFNGEPLSKMSDPSGNSVTYKFFTSKNTEYVLSAANMARRIKKAGLNDDGLHQWTDKTVFVDYDVLVKIMNVISGNIEAKTPTKVVSDWKSSLSVSSINEDGEWEESYATNGISAVPELGKHVLEFNFDGDGIVKSYHPGHDVSYIAKAC